MNTLILSKYYSLNLKAFKYIFFLVAFVTSVAAFAQPTFSFTPKEQIGNTGDLVCQTVIVDDFTDILSFSFQINYDPSVLQFENITILTNDDGVSLPGLSPANFVNSSAGQIQVSWQAPGNSSGNGETLRDGKLAQICYRIIGSFGSSSVTRIADTPEPDIRRENTATNIGLFSESGIIAVGTLPLKINVDSQGALNGSSICLPIRAKHFFNLKTVQFSVNWNTSDFDFEGVSDINPLLVGLQASDIVNTSAGQLSFNYKGNPDGTGTLIPDDEILFRVCLKVKAVCGLNAGVSISDVPTKMEATHVNNNEVIAIVPTAGQVQVRGCNNGVQIFGNTQSAKVGDVVCIPFKVRNWRGIESIEIDIRFDPSLIQYQSVSVATGAPFGMNQNSFDITQIGQGLIHLSWKGIIPNTLSDGRDLFSLCFQVKANTNIPIQILPDPATSVIKVVGSSGSANFLPGPGVINTTYYPPVQVFGANQNVVANNSVCIPISVANFNQVTKFSFELSWDPTLFSFDAINLPSGALYTLGNFTITAGRMVFTWDAGSPTSLGDNYKLFDLCLQASNRFGECSPIQFGTSAGSLIAQTINVPVGEGVGITTQSFEACILNDEKFTLKVGTVDAPLSGQECIDLSVKDYNSVDDWTISLMWNSSQYNYRSFQQAALVDLEFDVSQVALGRLGIRKPSKGNLDLPDNIVISKICFQSLDVDAPCSDIVESVNPLSNYAKINGQDGRIIVENGAVCTKKIQSIQVNETITHETCTDAKDGAISLTVTGGSGQYTYSWTNVSSPSQKDQMNLGAGSYQLTVTDNVNSSLQYSATFKIGRLESTPDAVLPSSLVLPCNNNATGIIDGSASTLDTDDKFSWVVYNGTVRFISNRTSLNPTIAGAGNVQLIVTSPSGVCRDTAEIAISQSGGHSIAVVKNEQVSCDNTIKATQEVEVSPSGVYTYQWSTTDGDLTGVVTDQKSIDVATIGTYTVVVTDDSGQCSKVENVVVSQTPSDVMVDVGDDLTLDCGQKNIRITATGNTSIGPLYEQQWHTLTGSFIGQTDLPTVVASSPGTYWLTVTEKATGCSASDTLQIVSTGDSPIANAGADQELSCSQTVVTLDGSQSSSGMFTYLWTTTNGTIPSGTENNVTINVVQAGTYKLEVTNNQTGCSSEDIVQVTLLPSDLKLDLAPSFSFECNDVQPILPAKFLTVDSNLYTFVWQNQAGTTVGNSASLVAAAAGKYYVTTTEKSTGCQGLDSTQVSVELPPSAIMQIADSTLICSREMLLTSLSQPAQNISSSTNIFWIGANLPSATSDPFIWEIAEPGEYTYVVSSANGKCADTVKLNHVVTDQRINMSVEAQDVTLDCEHTKLPSALVVKPSNLQSINYTWSALSGVAISNANDPSRDFNVPDQYVITIEDTQSNCQARDTIVVTKKKLDFGIDLVDEVEILCGEIFKQVSASVTGSSSDKAFEWKSSIGSINGSISNVAASLSEGVHQIIVRDTISKCVDSASIKITREDFTSKVLITDVQEDNCELTANLSAMYNHPIVSGEWTLLDGDGTLEIGAQAHTAQILANKADTFVVSYLVGGTGCDTMAIKNDTISLTKPIVKAIDDQIKVTEDIKTGYQVYLNDTITNEAVFQFFGFKPSGIDMSSDGLLGNIDFQSLSIGTFNYQVCDKECVTVCDTAQLVIEKEIKDRVRIPNAITPNGDGLNDAFIIQDIVNDPDLYSNVRVTIFNRWGDLVYLQQPYANDWKGTNQNGELLPEGVYYYVVVLSLKEKSILKGNLTILRNK